MPSFSLKRKPQKTAPRFTLTPLCALLMSALIVPATQAALLPSGNVEATDPAYELDFTGDHKYQGGTVTFTQGEISFRGVAFEIAKTQHPLYSTGKGKIFLLN